MFSANFCVRYHIVSELEKIFLIPHSNRWAPLSSEFFWHFLVRSSSLVEEKWVTKRFLVCGIFRIFRQSELSFHRRIYFRAICVIGDNLSNFGWMNISEQPRISNQKQAQKSPKSAHSNVIYTVIQSFFISDFSDVRGLIQSFFFQTSLI